MPKEIAASPEVPEETFETWLDELENVVENMEEGDLTLERSLALFERGIALSDRCQRALHTAEQKVRILTANDAEASLEPFSDDE
jgi:exodeoxyribonuclease VII small subunit